jgi:hypothetical protein
MEKVKFDWEDDEKKLKDKENKKIYSFTLSPSMVKLLDLECKQNPFNPTRSVMLESILKSRYKKYD